MRGLFYDIDLRLYFYLELLVYFFLNLFAEVKDFLPGGIPMIDQYQGLFVVHPSITESFSLKPTLLHQPASRYLEFVVIDLIKRGVGMFFYESVEGLL